MNQLARREPGEVRALLRSGEELRNEQQRALEGRGAADLQKRVDEQRRAVRALARLGHDILVDEGRSVSDAIVERIGKTLDAAALDERSRALLRAGRLTEELEPPGFEAVAGMASTAAARKRPAADRRGKSGKSGGVAEARKRVTESKSEARARDREAVRAEREADRAEQAAAETRRVAEEARARADDAERALAEAEAALRAARRQ